MNKVHFKVLLDRYLNDSLQADELHEFIAYLRQNENTDQLQQTIRQALADKPFEGLSDKSRADIIFKKILEQASAPEKTLMPGEQAVDTGYRRGYFSIFRRVAAAVIILFIGGSLYYVLRKDRASPEIVAVAKPPEKLAGDAAPGGNRAILKLGDGKEIVLDEADTGTLTQQGSTKVVKLSAGELVYNTASTKNSAVFYNTVSTPRGGQYQVVLPDGSKVWLNAASSLRFPTVFEGAERSVILTGEAYFEVAHNKHIPFTVHVNDMNVQVLGTHFNIMAYENEKSVQTTLLEGSVSVSAPGTEGEERSALKLKPGQQASMDKATAVFNIHETDVESAVAWKNGKFQFSSADIKSIMRQIERWYDVDVNYEGKIPDGHYSGAVGRDNNLLKMLRIFEESDLRFTIAGKKLTVLQ